MLLFVILFRMAKIIMHPTFLFNKLYQFIIVTILYAIIGAATLEKRLQASVTMCYTCTEDILLSFVPWLCLTLLHYSTTWISITMLTIQYYCTHWFFIWLAHGRPIRDILKNPARHELRPMRLRPSYKNWRDHDVDKLDRRKNRMIILDELFEEAEHDASKLERDRELRRLCRLHCWTSMDAYQANCSIPSPILGKISDMRSDYQAWMIYFMPLENLVYLIYSHMLLFIGISYFLGRIGLYALGYLNGPPIPKNQLRQKRRRPRFGQQRWKKKRH